MKDLIIAIDGYSSCGKSTLAKDIAAKLGYIYIDSGAMYRAVTLFCLEHKIIDDKLEVDMPELLQSLDSINITFEKERSGKNKTFLNGRDVENDIRLHVVSSHVSIISKIKAVREKLVKLQRRIGENGRIVMDGRDIGTVVFPEAHLKLFMVAEPDIRARRRYDEIVRVDPQITIEEINENLKMRDHYDETRSESPLKKADDAVTIDNSNLTREQQLTLVMKIIEERFA